MNREIKFRVWDTDSQKMISLGELLCWEHGYTNTNFTTINRSITPRHRDIFSTDNNIWIKESKNRFILQQFTGLLDKNNREIYEGDILKDEKYGVSIVEWIENLNTCCNNPEMVGFSLPENYKKYKIIGNLFENPELLEEKCNKN